MKIMSAVNTLFYFALFFAQSCENTDNEQKTDQYKPFSMNDDPGGSPDRHSTAGRKNISVWVSFDGGETWPVKRWVHKNGGYSNLAAGRPGTPSEGLIYLTTGELYARLNRAWVTGGRDWK